MKLRDKYLIKGVEYTVKRLEDTVFARESPSYQNKRRVWICLVNESRDKPYSRQYGSNPYWSVSSVDNPNRITRYEEGIILGSARKSAVKIELSWVEKIIDAW